MKKLTVVLLVLIVLVPVIAGCKGDKKLPITIRGEQMYKDSKGYLKLDHEKMEEATFCVVMVVLADNETGDVYAQVCRAKDGKLSVELVRTKLGPDKFREIVRWLDKLEPTTSSGSITVDAPHWFTVPSQENKLIIQ